MTADQVDHGSVADILLIDALMPAWDADIAAHRIVRADAARTFQAARDLDFLSVHSPLLAASMWLRGLPDRLSRRPSVAPPRLVLSAGDELPGWAVLGEQPGRELAFGAIGRFWQPSIEWHDVPAADFAAFAVPGWGKIVADFSVVPYGEHASLLTYECRTTTTDTDSRARFLRYWRLVRPFVGHIFRATVATIAADAESD
jgi:hypothetical protein